MARQQPTGEASLAVQRALEPVVEGLALVLEEVTVTRVGTQRLLRVMLDATAEQDATLTLDEVADASRAISVCLDASDVMGAAPYVLEVSSPGVERSLTQPRHFRRNVRRRVQVELRDGSEVIGRVLSADETLVMSIEGPKKGMTRTSDICWDDVARGLVQIEFKPLEAPQEPADEANVTHTDSED